MTATDTTSPTTASTSRAAALLQVVDHEARWSNLQANRAGGPPTLLTLNEKQRAYESFRLRLSSYEARYATTYESEPLLGNPVRLAAWCGAMRALCLEAAADGSSACPSHLIVKAYRLAERSGLKAGETPPHLGAPAQGIFQAAEQLEALGVWLESLARVGSRPVKVPA